MLSLSLSLGCGDYFAGGVLLSVLATISTVLDHYLRSINEGFSIGFTSILIIVSSLFSGMAFTFLHYVFIPFCILTFSAIYLFLSHLHASSAVFPFATNVKLMPKTILFLPRSFKQIPFSFFCLHFQVGSIIELRRSYQAYNVMPSLSKALNRYGV